MCGRASLGLEPGWREVQHSLVCITLTHAKVISVPEKAVVPTLLPMNPGKDSEKLVQCSFILELTSTFKSL